MIHQFPRICIWIHKIYLQTLSATLKNGMVRFAFFKPCDGSIISGFPPREKHDFQVQRFWSSRFLHGASGCFISICWEHSDFSKQREHLMHQFGSVVSVVAIQNISKREKMVFSCIFFCTNGNAYSFQLPYLWFPKGLRQQRVYPKVCHFLLELRCQWKMKRFSIPECSLNGCLNLLPPQKKRQNKH